jgi:hypothetical protein
LLDAAPVDSPPALEVRGQTTCPRPAEVAAELQRVVGAAAPGAARDVAELREEGDVFVVVLRRASGEVVGEKRVPTTLGCAVRAEVAAVALAALEAQLPADDERPLALPPEPAPLVLAPAAPSTVSPPARSPTAPAGASPPAPIVVERAAAVRAPFGYELGAAALVSLNGGDVAPAGRVELALRRDASPWALGVSGLVVGTHARDVYPGRGTWWRWGGELAVLRASQLAAGGRVEVRAGVALTALEVAGSGFPRNGGATLFDPGAVVGARVSTTRPGVRPWLGLLAVYWPRPHDLAVVGAGPSTLGAAPVRSAEVLVGAGASFGAPR